VEEDGDFRAGTEFPHKLCKYDGYHMADFVEEDAYTIGTGDNTATVRCGEFELPTFARSEELGGLETVFPFRFPLLLLAEAPQDKDARENACEHEREPGTGGDFGQCGGEIDAIEATKDEEEEDYD